MNYKYYSCLLCHQDRACAGNILGQFTLNVILGRQWTISQFYIKCESWDT